MQSSVDRIKPDSRGITTYLDDLRRGQYQIPTFQRDVVWDRQHVKRLWDSIYKFYPLGSILVWLTDVKLHDHRAIGGHLIPSESPDRRFHYLLDGQQRTTALLTAIYGGCIKGQEGSDPQLYVNLTLSDPPELEDESWRERFLFRDEIERNTSWKEAWSSGRIVTLEEIAHQYHKTEERLERQAFSYGAVERSQLRKFKEAIDNYRLSFIELREIGVAEVCQVFERINQAGQPLNIFDIVVAKTYRPETDSLATATRAGFYLRGVFEDFRDALRRDGSRYSTIDDLTLLQIVAILVQESFPGAPVHNITERYLNLLTAEHIEGVWNDAKEAIRRTFDFLHNHLSLSGPRLVPYRYFYMILATYFFRNRRPDYEMVKQYFWYVSFHNDDLLSNTTQLREQTQRLREAKAGKKFSFGPFRIDRERLRISTYSSRGRLSRAMLALYANQNPKDWQFPDRSVLADVYYVLTDQPNLHHIFPLSFCEKQLGGEAEHANSLLNIAYLTQITNLQIGDRNPLEYVKDYVTNGFAVQERTHLLPTMLAEWAQANDMPPKAFNCFIDARLELVLARLHEYLHDITFDVIDTRVAVSG
jgi:hypothetical protein